MGPRAEVGRAPERLLVKGQVGMEWGGRVWRSRGHIVACPWGRPRVSVLADVKNTAKAICNRLPLPVWVRGGPRGLDTWSCAELHTARHSQSWH